MKNDISMPAGIKVAHAAKEIVGMPVGKAEKAIEVIADREGDNVARAILEHLPPVKIAAILRQHDFSCPSIISWMMTPQTTVDVLRVDPLFWMHVHDRKNFGNFAKIQRDALDLILAILSNAKNLDQQRSILHRMRSDGLSLLYLLLPFVGWEIKDDQKFEFEDPEIDFGTVDHLYEVIRWADSDIARQVFEFVCSDDISLIFFVTDLWIEAYDNLQLGFDLESVENIMFLPIR